MGFFFFFCKVLHVLFVRMKVSIYYLKIHTTCNIKKKSNKPTVLEALRTHLVNVMDKISCTKQGPEFHWYNGLYFGKSLLDV